MFKSRILTLAVLLTLGSCQAAPAVESKPDPWKPDVYNTWTAPVLVWVDPGTGCHYLIMTTGRGSVMIPRLQSGTPYCSDDDITERNEEAK